MVKTPEDYIPYLQSEFPDLPEEVLKKIVRTGLKGMQYLINEGHDVRFWNPHPGREYHIAIVDSSGNTEERHSRARKNFYRLKSMRRRRLEKAEARKGDE